MPPVRQVNVTFKRAPKERERRAQAFELDFAAPPLRKVAEPGAIGYPAAQGRKPRSTKKPRKKAP